MKTLIIYDKNGTIIKQIRGDYLIPVGIPFIEVEVPKGKYVVSINVETNQPIYDDIPPTEMEVITDKINVLNEVNELQEENIATLSYEVMMLQAVRTAVMTVAEGQHSPKFNMIRIWFNKGFWTESMVRDAVEHKWLTQEEADEIIGV